MKFKISQKQEEVIVISVYDDKEKINFFDKLKNKKLKENIKKQIKIYPHFKAKKDQQLFFNIEKQKILLIGLNEKYTIEEIREAYSSVFKTLKSREETIVTIEVIKENEDIVKGIIEGMYLTDYEFDKYKSKDETKKQKNKIDSSNKEIFASLDIEIKFNKIIKDTITVLKNTHLTRDMVNENSDILTPEKFAEVSKKFAKQNKLKIRVLNEKQIQKEQLNLLWNVGKGSYFPPRLIIVEYNGNPKSKEKIALVGKGVTFDTGGTNLKPTGYLEDMKTDMAGAATVFGAFKSAVELKLQQNIILVISAAENSLSSNAYKPGDIIKSYSGKTVEIGNTDAEGRLVLADAISYVQKNYKPTQIINVATLTGACLVALGPNLIAILGNDKKLQKSIFEAGEKTGERGWQLPIYDEHRNTLKSDFADMKNHGGKYGGTITGAAFIEKFIDEKNSWAHLDIAGAGRTRGNSPSYVSTFGTGRGVRLLVEYFKNN